MGRVLMKNEIKRCRQNQATAQLLSVLEKLGEFHVMVFVHTNKFYFLVDSNWIKFRRWLYDLSTLKWLSKT